MEELRITDVHMLVLAWIRDHPASFAEDVAAAFGLGPPVAHQLCTDLERAGFISPMTMQ